MFPIRRLVAVGATALLLAAAPHPIRFLRAERDPSFHVADSVVARLSFVTDMAIDPDGSVYLTDWHFPVILQLESDGSLRRPIGRSGSGPGEFASLLKVGVLHDSVWAMDPALVRLTMMPRSGPGVTVLPWGVRVEPIRDVAHPQALDAALLGPLPDGSYLAQQTLPRNDRPGDGPGWVNILRTNRQLQILDTVASYPYVHSAMTFMFENGEAHWGQPFADDPLFTVSGNGVVAVRVDRRAAERAAPSTFEVTAFGNGRGVRWRREIGYRPRRVLRGVVDSIAREWAAPRPSMRDRLPLTPDSIRSHMYQPRYYPPVEWVIAGSDGSVWLKLQTADGPTSATEWLCLSADGQEVARVATPPTFRLLEATRRVMYGVEGDPDDIPVIVRYRVP